MERQTLGVYAFGHFQLDLKLRRLTRDGTSIKLPARLFEALLYLVENDERLISQDELEQAIWPGRTMDRSNLAKAISSLRSTLRADGADEQIIITVPGRGYRFGAVVTFTNSAAGAGSAGMGGLAAPADGRVIASPPSAMTPGRLATASSRAVTTGAAILGMVTLLGVGFHFVKDTGGMGAVPPPRSIAVLPFANTSGDATQDYLSGGMTDELINSLGNVRPLRVAARTSSISFRGKTPTIREVADALNVASVLDGTVRRVGQTMMVTAELTDTKTGYALWSHRYDVDERDFLPTERQIVESVVATLKIALSGDAAAKTATGGTADPDAFDFYMRAMAMLQNGENRTFEPAFTALSRALTLDSHYALAWAQRARLLLKWQSHSTQALKDAGRAVELAPDLGFSHATLGMVLTYSLVDFARAKAEFTRAVDIAPNDATALMDYGFFQVFMGDGEHGLASAKQALALDPLTAATHNRFALLSALSGHFEDAVTALRHVAILRGDQQELQRSSLGLIRTWQGDAQGAVEQCGRPRDWHDQVCLAIAYHRLGDQAAADKALAQARSELGDDGAYNYATVYAVCGDSKEAISWLQRAFKLQDSGLVFLRADPLLKSLRNTQEFAQLERALGFLPRANEANRAPNRTAVLP